MSSLKRGRGSPTGETPKQPSKKPTSRLKQTGEQVRLFPTVPKTLSDSPWSLQEMMALVEFLLFYGFSTWPATKNDTFWDKCADFVEVRSKSSVQRTG